MTRHLIQDPDLPGTYVRALRVLAICPLNRSLILEAGALDPLAELLCSLPLQELEAVLFTLSLLSKEEDARLNTFPPPALDRLLHLLKAEDACPELRAISASTLGRLSHSFQNRYMSLPSAAVPKAFKMKPVALDYNLEINTICNHQQKP